MAVVSHPATVGTGTGQSWMRLVPPTFVVLTIALFLGMAKPFHSDKPNEWDDVYLRAARQLAVGSDLYQEVPLYTYPPFMAWLFLPFTWVPVQTARMAWFLVCAGSILVMVRCAWRLANAGGPRLFPGGGVAPPRWIWLVFSAGLVFGARPAFTALLHHQTDLLMGALIFIGIFAVDRNRPGWGAVCFGVAGAMKCTPLLWCAYFLVAGPRRWLLMPMLVGLAANLAPNLTHPPVDGSLWLHDWVNAKVLGLMGTYPGHWNTDVMCNQSLAGSGYAWSVTTWVWTDKAFVILPREPLFTPLVLKAIVYGVGFTLLAATLLVIWRQSKKSETPVSPADSLTSLRAWLLQDGLPTYPTRVLHCSMILLLMLLLSPMSHKTHFGLLLLPGFVLARLAWEKRSLVLLGLIGLLFVVQIGCQHFWSVRLSHLAYWHGVQMFTTLFLWGGCTYATLCWHPQRTRQTRSAPQTARRAA